MTVQFDESWQVVKASGIKEKEGSMFRGLAIHWDVLESESYPVHGGNHWRVHRRETVWSE